MDNFWEAGQLARDLGYPCANPAFWKWSEDVGLTTLPNQPMAFGMEDVTKALRKSR